MPGCAHVVAGKRLRTNNHNHRQFAHTRRTGSQPVPASHRRIGRPTTARLIQLEWRPERKVLLPADNRLSRQIAALLHD